MQRRNFITSSCKVCALGAISSLLVDLTGCAPALPVYKTAVSENTVSIPLSLFDNATLQLVRPGGWLYNIAVRKKEDNSYLALLMLCTHQENQLNATANGFYCSLHGSQFDKEGSVRKGPAERRLEEFKTSIGNGSLIIHLKNS